MAIVFYNMAIKVQEYFFNISILPFTVIIKI